MNLSIIAGPLIGAVIGYFTNYLAVKMLFRPRTEIKFMGKTLPFTPGVIPKGKPRLAKTIGRTVAGTLLTEEDLGKHLLSDEMKSAVSNRVIGFLAKEVKCEITEITGISEETYDEGRVKVCDTVSNEIYEAVISMPIKETVTEAMLRGVNEKLEEMTGDSMMGGMIAMMLPQERIMSIIEPIGGKIAEYVEEHCMEYIRPILDEKALQIENTKGTEIAEMFGMSQGELKDAIENIYVRLVKENIASVFKHMDLAALIEEKINAMGVKELEEMVMSVMKKELNTIVRLGALIGLVIGTLNIFI